MERQVAHVDGTTSSPILMATPALDAVVGEFLPTLGHQLTRVVTGPGPARRRSDAYLDVVRATPPGVDVLVTTHMGRLASMLMLWRPNDRMTSGFLWKLPPVVLAVPRLGTINLHGSLLPRGRGPNPVGWAFRNDDRHFGFTIHRMDAGINTGPILAQTPVPIRDEDDVTTLLARVQTTFPDLITQGLDALIRGEVGISQDETQVTEAPLFEDAWREIDWRCPARAVHNQMRSWTGFRSTPRGAFGIIDGEGVLVTRTQLASDTATIRAAPGDILRCDDHAIQVQCGDGPLLVREWGHLPR